MKFLVAFTLLWATAVASPLGIEVRISNGVGAFAGEFPYMVFIETRIKVGILTCGGALISSRWVLTAAHCIDCPGDGNIINVYLGATYRDDAEIGYVLWAQDVVRAHPFWERKAMQNDIALIEIPETVSCTRIKPVPLPPLNPTNQTPRQTYVGESVIASGWGQTSDFSKLSGRLQWGRMRIASNDACRKFKPWIDDTEVCVDTSIDLVSICIGDSGGPLVLESTDELIGVASQILGTSCGKGEPVVFTRITSYLQWIKSVTGISY